jgi:uncharacterized protein DUF2877
MDVTMDGAIPKQVDAISMSWRVARAVRQEGWSGEVLAVHPRSCYITGEDADIFAVVQQPLGNGPFSLVIPPLSGDPLAGLTEGSSVTSTGSYLTVGDGLVVGLAQALLWDPKAYPALGAHPEALSRCLAGVYQAATTRSPEQSLARLLPHLHEEDLPQPLAAVGHFPRSHALIAGLTDSLARRNRRSLKVVTSSLAGLGPGLTPAGDDFLAGVLLALALTQEHRADADLAEIAGLLLETAAPRTHEISAAYLRAAHAGETSEQWHALIRTLSAGNTAEAAAAAETVMRFGETSGADMLAGFLVGMGAIHNLSAAAWPGMMLPSAGVHPPANTPRPTT